ncbi:putative cytoplasmic protein [Salmonella enterica subsp. enterica]|uniref:2-oxoadipate dioxygenase/decarboxylase n=1 Tax=Salmonella enterica I TaxID=59201 RepID=A0A447MSJ6_SALET|nr:putative cytoplasmic protein [Salmonella enterica subsp. enterica]
MLDEYDEQGGFSAAQAEEFVRETLETFRWHRQATVDEETYRSLHREHRLIADVVCFPGCHINHLTPRTLDIDRVQAMMPECGITPKISYRRSASPRSAYSVAANQFQSPGRAGALR